MKYHAKDLKEVAKHFDAKAKAAKAEIDKLRSDPTRRPTRALAQLEAQFRCYCEARDILNETELAAV